MREYSATVKIDRQKRITIPKAIRDEEGLEPGDVIEVVFKIKDREKHQNKIGELGTFDALSQSPAPMPILA